MKYFIIALACLVAVVGIIIFNCIYINGVSQRLLSYIDQAEQIDVAQSSDITKTIYDFWDKEFGKVSLSVRYSEIDKVDDHVAMLLAASESCDADEYKKALELLRGAAEEIARLEQLKFSNIF